MGQLLYFLSSILLITLVSAANGANILGIFTSPSVSHLVVHIEMAKTLADRGHNITIVTVFEPKVNYENINVVVIPPTEEQNRLIHSNMKTMSQRKSGIRTTIKHFLENFTNFIDMQADVLKDPRFTRLYASEDTKFDLIILGLFMNTYQLGVAAKFQAPIVVNWLSSTMSVTNRFIGNPSEISYVPGMTDITLQPGEKMNFFQRAQNLFMNFVFEGLVRILDVRMKQHYSDLFLSGDSFPSLEDMYKNISLVFCNSHFSEGTVRPNVPALIEIGGIHLKEKADPLPEDLANFLEMANENGFIFFSLGSNFKGSSLNMKTVKLIFKIFSHRPEKIIWKWEDEINTPGNSSNILYRKWLPQDDILAHPNLKLFITHAGRGGITEAQYHGVPMLAIPLFGDQHDNAKKMVKSGFGQMFDILEFSEDTFAKALEETLVNPKYSANVQRFSRLYRDRPLSARENFIYWTEYVLRHHGAAHMQSPLVHMNLIERNNLDVFAFMALVVLIICILLKLLFKLFCLKNFGKNPKQQKNLRKNNTKSKLKKIN